MYFHPKRISNEAINALQEVGLTFDNEEMLIDNNEWPSQEWESSQSTSVTLRGVHIAKKQIHFEGHRDALLEEREISNETTRTLTTKRGNIYVTR